jgi:hypothetical protein
MEDEMSFGQFRQNCRGITKLALRAKRGPCASLRESKGRVEYTSLAENFVFLRVFVVKKSVKICVICG